MVVPRNLIAIALLVGGLAAHADVPDATAELSWHEDDLGECGQLEIRTLDSVVRVSTPDGSQGSGVVIGSNRVLTAAHVVGEQVLVEVEIEGLEKEATVRALSPSMDLAILEVKTNALQPIKIMQSALRESEFVWTVGYPLGRNLRANRGEFQRIRNGKLYTANDIQSGHSGGGLLRCRGDGVELAGMISSFPAYWGGDAYVKIDNVSISIPAWEILAFVDAVQAL